MGNSDCCCKREFLFGENKNEMNNPSKNQHKTTTPYNQHLQKKNVGGYKPNMEMYDSQSPLKDRSTNKDGLRQLYSNMDKNNLNYMYDVDNQIKQIREDIGNQKILIITMINSNSQKKPKIIRINFNGMMEGSLRKMYDGFTYFGNVFDFEEDMEDPEKAVDVIISQKVVRNNMFRENGGNYVSEDEEGNIKGNEMNAEEIAENIEKIGENNGNFEGLGKENDELKNDNMENEENKNEKIDLENGNGNANANAKNDDDFENNNGENMKNDNTNTDERGDDMNNSNINNNENLDNTNHVDKINNCSEMKEEGSDNKDNKNLTNIKHNSENEMVNSLDIRSANIEDEYNYDNIMKNNYHYGRFFQIYYNPILGDYYLKDLGNGMGAFVKINGKIDLPNNSLLCIGNTFIIIHFEEQENNGLLSIKLFNNNNDNENNETKEYIFNPSESNIVKIGRDPVQNSICIFDPLISKKHCMIINNELGGWTLVDGSENAPSTNGTWLLAFEDTKIEDGTVFKSGFHLFSCSIEEEEEI